MAPPRRSHVVAEQHVHPDPRPGEQSLPYAPLAPLIPLADEMEAVQLEMALDLLEHVDRLVVERRTTPEQLRYAVARLAESLRDVHRIAVSRGAG
ncbi:hypothetical protein [Streptomyces benahoarensis]|uniref:hypothetical protein n=1 Tax=Streptomyces benahoarensis TaxID=2595054 RepID=UPI003D808DD3